MLCARGCGRGRYVERCATTRFVISHERERKHVRGWHAASTGCIGRWEREEGKERGARERRARRKLWGSKSCYMIPVQLNEGLKLFVEMQLAELALAV